MGESEKNCQRISHSLRVFSQFGGVHFFGFPPKFQGRLLGGGGVFFIFAENWQRFLFLRGLGLTRNGEIITAKKRPEKFGGLS